MFGVLDSPEYSGVNTGVYRPVINDGKDEHANLPSDGSTVDSLHGFIPSSISSPSTGPIQVKKKKKVKILKYNLEKHLCSTLLSQCLHNHVVIPCFSL